MGRRVKCIFIKSGCLLFYSVISNECLSLMLKFNYTIELYWTNNYTINYTFCFHSQSESSLETFYSKFWLFIGAKHSYIQNIC